MEQNQIVNTTIPLWGILTGVASAIALAVWNGIKLYFNSKTMYAQILEEKDQRIALNNRIELIKTQFATELESHKKETDREFGRINTKLDSQKETLTEVKTYVKLLVEDKIKKNG